MKPMKSLDKNPTTTAKTKTQSPKQYGMLRYFSENTVPVDRLGTYNQVTIWSLLNRGYLVVRKTAIRGVIREIVELSKTGWDDLNSYLYSRPAERLKNGPITPRVLGLLVLARAKAGKKAA